MKRRCRPFGTANAGASMPWQNSAQTVPVVLCDEIPGAAAFGLGRPYIAVSPPLASRLTAEELEQVILHEYAHLCRRDDWTRLFQALIMPLVWLHPAAHLIARELEIEREAACDDWVVAGARSPRGYATCLARVAEIRLAAGRSLAPALLGATPVLVQRVDRLLNGKRRRSRRASWCIAAPIAGVLGGCAVLLTTLPLVAERASAALAETPAPADVDTVIPADVSSRQVSEIVPHPGPAVRRQAVRERISPEYLPRPALADVRPEAPGAATAAASSGQAASVPEAPAELPVISGGRTFTGVLSAPDEPRPRRGWSAAGGIGTGLGTAARDAGIGLGNSLSAAGLSIARSF